MSSKQLILFKGIDVKRLDSVLTELYNLIYATKTLALIIETTHWKNKAFDTALLNVALIAELCSDLSDLSFKYMAHTEDMSRKSSSYNPYYSALEPRSPSRVVEIAFEYKSQSKAILLRLRACLEKGSIKIPYQVEEINKNFAKIPILLNESTKL